MMRRLHSSFQRFFSMTGINHVDWAVADPWIYATWIISRRAAKLAASPPPAMPHRPVGHVKRHRPARAGCRGGRCSTGRHAVALTEHGATLQAARDDVAAVSARSAARLPWEPLSTPGHLTSPASRQTSATAIPGVAIKLRRSKDGSVGLLQPVSDGSMDIALCAQDSVAGQAADDRTRPAPLSPTPKRRHASNIANP
jgi:hypothetical protein